MDLSGNPLLVFLRAFFGQSLGFLAVLSLVYGVVWVWGRKRFAPARIPTRKQADGAQIPRELRHTVTTLAVGAGLATAVGVLLEAGLTRLVAEPPWSPLTILASIVFLVVLNDTWFYFWHRLLHHPRLFRHVHAVHHQSVDVNPLSGWVVPVVMLVPLPLPVFGLVQVIGTANNVMSHLGYEFLPRWLLRVPGLRWMNTATFHSLHHTRFNGNYGLFFRFWDRLFGTEVPEYEAAFTRRGYFENAA
jgi:sterol desaturase/sphingolipid hydroxylase (fatty acid hydroxylase superfamily)